MYPICTLAEQLALIASIPSPHHHKLSDLLELGNSTGSICLLAGLYNCTSMQQASLETVPRESIAERQRLLADCSSNVGDQWKSSRWARFSVMLS